MANMQDNQGRSWDDIDAQAAAEGDAVSRARGYRVRTTSRRGSQDSRNRLLDLNLLQQTAQL